MPPIWEYAANGYRSPIELGSDIGLLTRYVAHQPPLHHLAALRPADHRTGAGGRKIVDMTMFEDDPGSSGAASMNPEFAKERGSDFQPYYRGRPRFRDVDPIDAGAKNALNTFTGFDVTPGCWLGFGTTFAQLVLLLLRGAGHVRAGVPPARLRGPGVRLQHHTGQSRRTQYGLLGFADDNWVDGTQSFVFAFDADDYRDLGYGFTATIDSRGGAPHRSCRIRTTASTRRPASTTTPAGRTFFAWAGDESDTVMHYLGLSNQFGEHNQDNMYRWEIGGLSELVERARGRHPRQPGRREGCDRDPGGRPAGGAGEERVPAVELPGPRPQPRAAPTWPSCEPPRRLACRAPGISAARRLLPEQLIRRYVCRPRQLLEHLAARK